MPLQNSTGIKLVAVGFDERCACKVSIIVTLKNSDKNKQSSIEFVDTQRKPQFMNMQYTVSKSMVVLLS